MGIMLAVTTVGAFSVFAATSDASDSYKVSEVKVTGIKPGNTLKLYKLVQFNLDPATNAFDYTFANNLPAAYDTIDELAALSPSGYTLADATDTIRIAADALAAGIAEGTITPIGSAVQQVAGSGDVATITDLPAGWYVAIVTGTEDDSIIYQNMIINAMPVVSETTQQYTSAANVNYEVKHTTVTIDKKVGDPLADTSDAYSVGDTVPYQITTNIPNYPSDSLVAKFWIEDTPSDLTDDITTDFTVKVNGTQVDASSTTWSVERKGEDGFTIKFVKDYILAHPGQPVVVNYNAVIKSSAVIDDNGLTAENTANLVFNPNPNYNEEVKPDDTTTLYTYGLTVLKHEDGNESKTLTGAKFVLYASDGTTVVRAETEVDANGKLTWDGLEAGSYKLVETKAPDGYRLDSTPRDITLSKDTATGDDPLKDGTQKYVLESKVPNTRGATLPSTGGMGTTIFYIIGVILLAGAAIILVTKRRMSAE